MKELEVYNPFDTQDYYIVNHDGKKYFLYRGLKLELSESGYIPKSGLLFDMILSPNNCNNKKVLDLGCGYLGILSIIAYINGAKKIEAIDYDDNCVKWFKKIIADNNLNNISCFKSDYFKNVDNKDFDLILANPPQMPMLDGTIHDSGGNDGRKYILEIFDQAFEHLSQNGSLYILLFDFLGINKKTSEQPTLMELALARGYSNVQVVCEVYKKINKGGITFENIPYIKTIYPNYDFYQNNDCKCKLKILEIRK